MSEIQLVGRNEACPCGSGKKFKRCHGVDAAPKLTVAKAPAITGAPGVPPGFDPSQMANMMKRLPKAQLVRLQAIMQRAMSGQDVSQDAQELERLLPSDFLKQMEEMKPALMQQAAAAGMPVPSDAEMDDLEARKIVEEAIQAGRLTREEAEAALAPLTASEAAVEGSTRWSKLWKGLKGKK